MPVKVTRSKSVRLKITLLLRMLYGRKYVTICIRESSPRQQCSPVYLPLKNLGVLHNYNADSCILACISLARR
jgi:hypothetical protein